MRRLRVLQGMSIFWLGLSMLAALVAIALLSVFGSLGGELSYRKHLGMVPDDGELERAEQRHDELRPAGDRPGRAVRG